MNITCAVLLEMLSNWKLWLWQARQGNEMLDLVGSKFVMKLKISGLPFGLYRIVITWSQQSLLSPMQIIILVMRLKMLAVKSERASCRRKYGKRKHRTRWVWLFIWEIRNIDNIKPNLQSAKQCFCSIMPKNNLCHIQHYSSQIIVSDTLKFGI